jgi:RNA polymerase sigma-70 factor (ECF subfamily)
MHPLSFASLLALSYFGKQGTKHPCMEEKDLVRLCKKNDRTAQKELYGLFAPEMLGVCYRYTKSLDDAEDVLQEAFVKVYTQMGQFRGEGALGGWIKRIMVTTAISYLRRHNRYRNQMDFDHQPLHVVAEETATANLNIRELMDLIQRLPAGYQTVFNLVGIEGYDHTEVAKMLGISVQTSRSQYSRARAQLMKWVEELHANRSGQTVQKL